MKSADGYTATYVVGAETKVRKNQKKAAAADLEADDRIFVVAVKDGSTLKAIRGSGATVRTVMPHRRSSRSDQGSRRQSRSRRSDRADSRALARCSAATSSSLVIDDRPLISSLVASS